ncbi:hypothetical protein KJ780_03650 [Candidatus Micrarchaeota archaeon]|nr:hypothetical protein [Candidatus Micrarchaeota archaeon]
MKDILCDASSLISLTDSCLAESIQFLTKKFNLSLLITDAIEYECIIHPLDLHTKEYSFSALRISDKVEKGFIKKISISPAILAKRNEMLNAANNIFFARGRPITLAHNGEMEILALASELGIKSIFMDERTTRLLIEAPFKIKEHFEKEFRTHVMVNKTNLDKLNSLTKGMYVFRSTEFLAFAYENGFFNPYGKMKKQVYSAALYKLKYAGCAISYPELEELINLA